MLLDVNDNRLDAQLIMADGSVQDKFTILKNVNKTTALTAVYGDTLKLEASWPGTSVLGDYRWSDGQTSRASRHVINKAGAFSITVKDHQNCLTDAFQLTVPVPKLTTKASTSVCVGSSLDVSATLDNLRSTDGQQYDVLLSDASGSFAKEQVVGSGKINELKATIPTGIPTESGYRLQVRPRGIPEAQLVASDVLAIKPLPTATLAGSTTITQGESFPLSITFTGEGPWKGTLSDGTTFSGTASPTVLTLKPTKSMVYSVGSIENSCGKGTVSGQASVTVLIPTGDEDFAGGQLRIYPNPAHDVVHVELTATQKKEVSLALFDLHGRLVFQKQTGQVMTLSESIPMPQAHGTYLLKVQVGEYRLTRKVVRQ